MRLIDADKLIEWIEDWDKNITKDINAPDVGEANHIIKDVLQAIVDQLMDMDTLEWIPVSEGLPNDYDMVLVTINSGGKGCITYCQYEYDDVVERGIFKDADGIWISDEGVTAWMRLPEPWEGEEDGEDS